jgi:predicted nucleic acid-binding protein
VTRTVADTSFIVALHNRRDQAHVKCLALYNQMQTIYLPQSTLSEVCYLLTKGGGNRATSSFLRSLVNVKYQLLALEQRDLERTADILDKYHDARLDFVDATIAAVAERLNITRLLTLDTRDFSLMRLRHAPYFEILPQPE